MREILFRGKDVRTGYWKEGSLVREWLGVDIGYTIRDVPDRFNQIAFRSIVDPKTIGQYTGLTDKDGKKIFEGDVCKFREWDNGEMCWIGHVHFEHCQFIISGRANKERSSDFYLVLSRFSPENIEVIGNIHDNPELLEADK